MEAGRGMEKSFLVLQTKAMQQRPPSSLKPVTQGIKEQSPFFETSGFLAWTFSRVRERLRIADWQPRGDSP